MTSFSRIATAIALSVTLTGGAFAAAPQAKKQPVAAKKTVETIQPAKAVNAPDVKQQAITEPAVTVTPESGTPAQTITGQAVIVAQPAPAAPLTARDILNVSFQPANDRGSFQGYRYILKNIKGDHLQILHAEVLNGVDEAAAANQEARQSQTRRRMAGGLLRGLSSAIPYAGGYGSMAAYRATAIGTGIASSAAQTMDAAADGTMTNVQGGYTRQLSSAMISPQDIYSFQTLVPKGQTPHLKVVFKSIESNQVYDYQD